MRCFWMVLRDYLEGEHEHRGTGDSSPTNRSVISYSFSLSIGKYWYVEVCLWPGGGRRSNSNKEKSKSPHAKTAYRATGGFLVRFAFAGRMAAAAVDVRDFFHGGTLDAAVFAGLSGARAAGMSAFLWVFGGHRFLPRTEFPDDRLPILEL